MGAGSPEHSVSPAGSVSEHSRVIAEHAADYISICSPAGRILYHNPALAKLGGPVFEALAGKDPADWDPRPAYTDRFLKCLRQVMETGKPQSFEMDFTVPATGQVVYHHIKYAPVWGADGKVVSLIGIGRDITKLKEAEAGLRSLNATLEERVEARTRELERANSDLRSFASTVSHDVRAPLRTIHQYLALLAEEEGERLSEDGRAILARVRSSATKLDHLTQAILKYSQAGQDVMAGENVAVAQLAHEVAEELVPRDSNVRITVAELPVARADPTMVRQILQNLIGNAVKYSAGRNAPHIEIGSLEEDGQVVYYVRDNGAGFDMQHAPKLFSMLGRLHTEDKFPGSGVGLAIVKRLVEKHGGRAWAEGRPDVGATFYFTLAR